MERLQKQDRFLLQVSLFCGSVHAMLACSDPAEAPAQSGPISPSYPTLQGIHVMSDLESGYPCEPIIIRLIVQAPALHRIFHLFSLSACDLGTLSRLLRPALSLGSESEAMQWLVCLRGRCLGILEGKIICLNTWGYY